LVNSFFSKFYLNILIKERVHIEKELKQLLVVMEEGQEKLGLS
jgi:hypothetical protein